MEPASAFGVAGAATDIVTVLSRTIKSIYDFRQRYRQMNLLFDLLDHQLNTLKSALYEMSRWTSEDCSSQLLAGSESAVRGISILVTLLEEKLQSTARDDLGALTFQGKLSLLWSQTEMREYLNQLNGQIMSLSILLQAYT